MSFVVGIKAVRKKMGLTQDELAHKLGVSWGTVARWEAGKNKPSKLARRALEDLLKETEGKPENEKVAREEAGEKKPK